MSPRQVSLSAWLLVFACGSTMADTLFLDTVQDEDNSNTVNCSLREAVAYIHQKNILVTTGNTTGLKELRTKGWWGCIPLSSSDNDIIDVPFLSKNYLITKGEILISDSLTFVDPNQNSTSTETKNDSVLTKIETSKNQRIFVINDQNSSKTITVSINYLDLEGCNDQTTSCAPEGGIIYNAENLELSHVSLNHGIASNAGGAIYNTGILTLDHNTYRYNQATNGSAIFSASGAVVIKSSLFNKNTASNTSNAVISLNSTSSDTVIHNISTSTFSENSGSALSATKNTRLNNNTIVANDGGVNFNNSLGYVYNSIIAGNKTDCLDWTTSSTTSHIQYNVFTASTCLGNSTSVDKNMVIGNSGSNQLFAEKNSAGECATPPAIGLLCPLGDNGGFSYSYKPRLLAYLNNNTVYYNSIDDSPIINKGSTSTSGDNSCESTDQRDKAISSEHCSLGSVALTQSDNHLQGQDVPWDTAVTFDMRETLGDAELIGHELCLSLTGHASNIDGCPEIINSPLKGKISFDGNKLIYTPSFTYHGSDEFSYKLMTTFSRFNDAENSKMQRVDVRIVSNPPDSAKMRSKQTNVGAINFFILSTLMMITMLRRVHWS